MSDWSKYYYRDIQKITRRVKEYNKTIVLNPDKIADIQDLHTLFTKISTKLSENDRLLIVYFNHLWKPILDIASFVGLRKKRFIEENWLDQYDLTNLLTICGIETITSQKRILIPINIPLLSNLINKYFANLPLVNNLCLTMWIVARKANISRQEYSTSIIVPARDEEGNISKIIKSIPKFGKWQEIIFVEGGSSDNTWKVISSEVKNKTRKNLKLSAYKQRGKGKADAVRLGFSKAKGDILMIYDADRTVEAKDLKKFYDVLASGKAEFANGSRLVYPMEKDAMRTLNKVGNKLFSILFTWILGQRFKDTLCGTKAIFRKDYQKIVKHRKKYGSVDPFGDFDLIFGTIRQNLKVVEIPVRYKERVYGSTNINRFRHGLLLFKMTLESFKQFRAY